MREDMCGPADRRGAVRMTRGSSWTIDYRGVASGLGNDRNGYLANARAWLPKHRQHHDVGSLFRNVEAIAARSRKGVLNIVGHGKPGILSAGSGDTPAGPGYILDAKNAMNMVTIRHRFGVVVLWGCAVGAGSAGVNLLANLADATGSLCMAPVDVVCCCAEFGFWLPRSSQWQVVLPSTKRHGLIPLPGYVMDCVDDQPWKLLDAAGAALNREHVTCVLLGKTEKDMQPIEGTDLLNELDLARPIVEKCPLGAFVTGYLKLEFDNGRTSKTFRILNHEIIEDQDTSTSYAATPRLAIAMKDIRRMCT